MYLQSWVGSVLSPQRQTLEENCQARDIQALCPVTEVSRVTEVDVGLCTLRLLGAMGTSCCDHWSQRGMGGSCKLLCSLSWVTAPPLVRAEGGLRDCSSPGEKQGGPDARAVGWVVFAWES